MLSAGRRCSLGVAGTSSTGVATCETLVRRSKIWVCGSGIVPPQAVNEHVHFGWPGRAAGHRRAGPGATVRSRGRLHAGRRAACLPQGYTTGRLHLKAGGARKPARVLEGAYGRIPSAPRTYTRLSPAATYTRSLAPTTGPIVYACRRSGQVQSQQSGGRVGDRRDRLPSST